MIDCSSRRITEAQHHISKVARSACRGMSYVAAQDATYSRATMPGDMVDWIQVSLRRPSIDDWTRCCRRGAKVGCGDLR